MLSAFFIDKLRCLEVGPKWGLISLTGDFEIGRISFFSNFSISCLTEFYSVVYAAIVAFLECLELICLGFFFFSSIFTSSVTGSSFSSCLSSCYRNSTFWMASYSNTARSYRSIFSSFSRLSFSSSYIFYKNVTNYLVTFRVFFFINLGTFDLKSSL